MLLGKHAHVAKTGSNITANVTIGNYTSIAPNVQMHSLVQHACITDPSLVSSQQLPQYPQPIVESTITIGNDVWIGQNVVILGDVTIGDGAIIGAFSVVAKDIPPYAIVVGNPAVIKRYRFSPEQITQLLAIAWWHWPDETLAEHAGEFLQIESFLRQNPKPL